MLKRFLIVLLFSPLLCFSQSGWIKKLPIRGIPVKMIKTKDGGYMLLAITDMTYSGFDKIGLIKCDSNGDIVWDKRISLSDSSRYILGDFVISPSGEIVIAGEYERYPFSKGSAKATLIKTNVNGDTLWTNAKHIDTLWTSIFMKVIELPDNTILTLGGGGLNWYVYKYDPSGLLLNTFTNDTFPENYYYNILLKNKKNNPFLNKYIDNNAQHVFVTDDNLNHLKDKSYGNVRARIAENSPDSGYVLCDTGLVKLDKDLNISWVQPFAEYKFAGFTYQYHKDLKATSDLGYIICGQVQNSFTKNVYLIKTDAAGKKVWVQNYWAVVDDVVSVEEADDGGYVMFQSNTDADTSNIPEMWLVKTDASGVLGIYDRYYAKKNIDVLVYPNPASDAITFEIPVAENTSICLFDLTGRLVLVEKFMDKVNTISISSIPEGIYILRGSVKNSIPFSKKIIISR